MILFITYLIKVFICSGVLYGYYAFALKNTPIHQWNRYYLLLSTLLSLVLPLLNIPVSFYTQPENQAYTTPLITLRDFMIVNKVQHDFSGIWIILYSGIATTLLTRLLLNWRRIHLLARTNGKDKNTGFILLENEQVQSPFSFFNHIFWSGNIQPDSMEGQQILRHEIAHITGHHTTDKILMETICAICWINPFFHLIKKDLSMVHEFIADQAAADAHTPADYARTILQLTLQTKQLPMVNSFSQAPVKRRILMLFNQKHNNTIMKKSIVLPMLVTLIAFISFQQKNIAQVKQEKEVYTFVEQPPEFPGGENALAAFLNTNIQYPKVAVDNKKQGTVFVNFVVEADGTVSHVKTVGPKKGFGLEEESIRVAKMMPKWTPGKHKGNLVAVEFNLPVRYNL